MHRFDWDFFGGLFGLLFRLTSAFGTAGSTIPINSTAGSSIPINSMAGSSIPIG